MHPSPAPGEDGAPPASTLIATFAQLPQRLLLSLVSAGVIAGLTLGAASVWLSAKLDRQRRD